MRLLPFSVAAVSEPFPKEALEVLAKVQAAIEQVLADHQAKTGHTLDSSHLVGWMVGFALGAGTACKMTSSQARLLCESLIQSIELQTEGRTASS